MQTTVKRFALAGTLVIMLSTPALAAAAAHAESTPTKSNTATSTSREAAQAAETATRLANIKSKGDAEIARRLASLNALSGKVAAATKLTASDKAALNAQITNEINGLLALKTKLDTETTADAAIADAKNIFAEYRVYALIVPKVALIKTADDQQAVEAKLTALAIKLQNRLSTAKTNGKDVTVIQARLDDLKTKVAAAKAISTSIEAKVVGLQPSDYNSDHAVLGGMRDQLKIAHADNEAAFADAKAIVTSLKSL